MILNCEMVREELFKVIPNLEAFDESEEFDTSMDTLKKRLRMLMKEEATGDFKE